MPQPSPQVAEPAHCQTVLPSGEIFSVPLREYLTSGLPARYSLVVLGPPGTGKTPLRHSISRCLALAAARSSHEEVEPHYFVTSQVDSLTSLRSALRSGHVILFDDWRPLPPREKRQCSPDDLKRIMSVTASGNVHTRYQNLDLPAGGRVFNGNTPPRSLYHWCSLFPQGDFADLSTEERKTLFASTDAGAFWKRALFCWVTESVIPENRKRARQDASVQAMAAAMSAVLD